MATIYIGNATQLDEEGVPYKHQVRYEEANSAWLRRRYDHYEDGALVEGKWYETRRKLSTNAGVYKTLIEEAMVEPSEPDGGQASADSTE